MSKKRGGVFVVCTYFVWCPDINASRSRTWNLGAPPGPDFLSLPSLTARHSVTRSTLQYAEACR